MDHVVAADEIQGLPFAFSNSQQVFANERICGFTICLLGNWHHFYLLKLPLPAPPLLVFVGTAGLPLGAFCYQYLNGLLGK